MPEQTPNKPQPSSPAECIEYMNQHGFQRLYLEYYAFLYDLDAAAITRLYKQGLGYNLKNSHFNLEVLHYVKHEIRQASQAIEKQKNTCISHFRDIPDSTEQTRSTQLQAQLREYLNNIKQQTPPALDKLIQAHHEHLQKHSEDLFALLNLAWIQFHLREDFQSAREHFADIADKSILTDSPVTQMALRYLAMCDFLLENPAEASASLQRAASLDQSNNLYMLYEIAQQLLHTGKTDAAISHLKALVKHSPLYFVHIQSDPFFANIPQVDTLLTRFHAAKLEEIKEITYSKWQASTVMQQPLPVEFNQQALFDTTYEEHRTLLTYQPYPLLCKTEKISEKFLHNLQKKTRAELKTLNQQISQRMKTEQTRWKIVNLLGVTLVYLAVLLTLASIFLFIGGDLLGLTSSKNSIDWSRLVPGLFAAVLGMGIAGIALLQFNPPTLKQLAKKKSMLNSVVDQ